MAKRATVLKVSGLKRAFGPNTILDKFNLEVRAGEAIALTGRNGAGKSTLLRCLVGADRPDEGTIEVLRQPDVGDLAGDPARRRHGDRRPRLLPRPQCGGAPRPAGPGARHRPIPTRMVDEVLEEVQLVPQSGQLPGTLSSGQRRRLALATAFVRPRKLLILDEPEQRLDTEGVAWLAARLKAGAAAGPGDRLRQPRADAGRDRRDPGRPARERPRMSTAEVTGDRSSSRRSRPRRPPLTPATAARAEAADQGLARAAGPPGTCSRRSATRTSR